MKNTKQLEISKEALAGVLEEIEELRKQTDKKSKTLLDVYLGFRTTLLKDIDELSQEIYEEENAK